LDVEVDQSGKIEDTRTDTVLAFSNGESRTALIPAVVKRACIHKLRQRDWRSQTFVFKIFAASLFLLISPYLSEIDRIVLDIEYPERMGDIKGLLLKLIRGKQPDFARGQIVFQRIGRQSPAHKRAIEVYRGQVSPDLILSAGEIMRAIAE
jgi:hypothetical protein